MTDHPISHFQACHTPIPTRIRATISTLPCHHRGRLAVPLILCRIDQSEEV